MKPSVMRPERRKRSRYIIQEEHPSATRSNVSYTGSVMFPNFLEFRAVSNFLEFRGVSNFYCRCILAVNFRVNCVFHE